MELALAEADKAASAGEIPVGAVVLDWKGNVIGTGQNACIATSDPTAHAEIMALRAAARSTGNYRLNGCFLAVTLEPCLMCTGALVHARIQGLVYGAPDPRAGAVTSVADGLDLPFHNCAVWHMGGILQSRCHDLLSSFFTEKR